MTKTCTKCFKIKELELFSKASHHKYGRGSWCAECKNKRGREIHLENPQKSRDQKTAWRKKNPGYFLRKYWPGSTSEQAWINYQNLLINQNLRCDICKKHKDNCNTPLEVDHCHKTGKVRGLLCSGCNPAIGGLKDDFELCYAAGDYLKKHF